MKYTDTQLLNFLYIEGVTFEVKRQDDWEWWECNGHKGKTPRMAISSAMDAECPPPPEEA